MRERFFFTFFFLARRRSAHRIEKKTRFSLYHPLSTLSLSLFPAFRPRGRRKRLCLCPQRGCKGRTRKNPRSPTSTSKKKKKKTMAEKAFDPRELGEALDAADADADADSATTKAGPSSTSTSPPKPLTIDDLPREILVSIFMAVGDLNWVRHNIPLVCKAWNEIYLSKDASPLHERLEVDFEKEVKGAWQEWFRRVARPLAGAAAQELAPYRPVVHASSIISWAERRAASVRKLDLMGAFVKTLGKFNAEDLSELLAVVGSSLTHISIGSEHRRSALHKLLRKPFWESLRDSVVPAGRLQSLGVRGIDSVILESDVEPLAQLAGSLEGLELSTVLFEDPFSFDWVALGRMGLLRFPEFICSLTKLRRLALVNHRKITAIPAAISSLTKLKELDLRACDLFSLPKELGELSGLTRLHLSANGNLGDEDEAFPAELGKLKALRELFLGFCDLRAVPAFVGELESLAILDLSDNNPLQIHAPLDFLIEGCPRLREVQLGKAHSRDPWTPESLTHLKAFKAKLLAKNPDAKVFYEREEEWM